MGLSLLSQYVNDLSRGSLIPLICNVTGVVVLLVTSMRESFVFLQTHARTRTCAHARARMQLVGIPLSCPIGIGACQKLLCVLAGVQMKEMPPASYLPQYQPPDDDNPDIRLTQYARDHLVVRDNEMFDDKNDVAE